MYQTGSPIVISGSWRVAITRVVVMPNRGKRNGTWMGFDEVCSWGPGGGGDVSLENMSCGVGDSGVVDTVYIWSKGMVGSGPSYILSNEESLKSLDRRLCGESRQCPGKCVVGHS